MEVEVVEEVVVYDASCCESQMHDAVVVNPFYAFLYSLLSVEIVACLFDLVDFLFSDPLLTKTRLPDILRNVANPFLQRFRSLAQNSNVDLGTP